MTAWQRMAALSRDHFAIDSRLGQHDLSKYYKVDVTISHQQEDGRKLSDKAMFLVLGAGHWRRTSPISGLSDIQRRVVHRSGQRLDVRQRQQKGELRLLEGLAKALEE